MPWPTTDGMRNLRGAESALVRGAIGMIVDGLVAELRDGDEPWRCGIDWMDQWDAGQKLWILRQVTSAFFGRSTIDAQAAIFDAAVDAIFLKIEELVAIEIDEQRPGPLGCSWRQSVIDAFRSQTQRSPIIDCESADLVRWRGLITQLSDAIVGVRLYQRAEPFRDLPYEKTRMFLRDRGLGDDYLSRIPPLRSTDQIQRSIDQIQAFVFD